MTNPHLTAAETDSFVSWREFLTSSYVPALVLVCLAVWLHAADSLIVATMLPSVVEEVGGAALVGWAVALYEIPKTPKPQENEKMGTFETEIDKGSI